jgi:dTDP-4-amino-4,6-dideoxygalactose transaminase
MEVAYSEALSGVNEALQPGSGFLPLNRLENSNWDFLASLPGLRDQTALHTLRDKFRELTGRNHIIFAPSCRSAIAQILYLLPQQEVVMPAYSCMVVKLAAQAARKTIIYTDVARGSVNSTAAEFEPHAKPGRVLIPTHLFGIPTDVEEICALAKQRGCVTIEDAAPSLAEPYGRAIIGTFCDFGVFSFERSKRLPAFRGAAIVVNNEGILDPKQLAESNPFGAQYIAPLREIVSSVLYNIASIPQIYANYVVPRQLKMYSSWNYSPRTIEKELPGKFFKRQFHSYQATLILRQLTRIKKIQQHIARLIAIYREEFINSPVITFLPENSAAVTLLRFPVVVPGLTRAEVLRQTLQSGLFLETNYERLLPDDLSGNDLANAKKTAESVILLPLYSRLPEREASRIAKQLVRIASAKPDAS